jgi:hypothetical protein
VVLKLPSGGKASEADTAFAANLAALFSKVQTLSMLMPLPQPSLHL